jgi:hypothetical protein
MIKDLETLIKMSVNYYGESLELACDVKLIEDGIEYQAYTVYVAHRDLLFLCEDATLNYDVNFIGRDSLLLVSLTKGDV